MGSDPARYVCEVCKTDMPEEHDGDATLVSDRGEEVTCCGECVERISKGLCADCDLEAEEVYVVTTRRPNFWPDIEEVCSRCLVYNPARANHLREALDSGPLREGARYLTHRKKFDSASLEPDDLELAIALDGFREDGSL